MVTRKFISKNFLVSNDKTNYRDLKTPVCVWADKLSCSVDKDKLLYVFGDFYVLKMAAELRKCIFGVF